MRGASVGVTKSDVPHGSRQSDILHISISDDTNPLNLYLASIDMPTFIKIRTEQNIFVEFS